MQDYVTLGPTPAEEECADMRKDDYSERSIRECRIYIRQLEREFPIPEGVDARYASKRFDRHEFGSYREVVLYFETEDRAAVNLALQVESKAPLKWDEAALKELEQTTAGSIAPPSPA